MKQSVQLGVAHVILVLLHLALQQHALSALLPECGLQLRQVRALGRFCQYAECVLCVALNLRGWLLLVLVGLFSAHNLILSKFLLLARERLRGWFFREDACDQFLGGRDRNLALTVSFL